MILLFLFHMRDLWKSLDESCPDLSMRRMSRFPPARSGLYNLTKLASTTIGD